MPRTATHAPTRRRALTLLTTGLAAGVTVAVAPISAAAKEAPIYTSWGLAIGGYDPVAYFRSGGPQQGARRYTTEWRGATWRFASAENRDAFQADPEAFAPQYGGYCAWAVSQGYTAPIDPDAWRILDGKLYLNYSLSVQRTWERDIPGNIAKGDRNFPTLVTPAV